jgi:hypothetical protein
MSAMGPIASAWLRVGHFRSSTNNGHHQTRPGMSQACHLQKVPRPQVCTRWCRRKSSKRSLKKYIRRPCRDRAIEF